MRTTLYQQPRNASCAKFAQRGFKVQPAVFTGRHFDDVDAKITNRPYPGWVAVVARYQPGRHLTGRRDETLGQRQPKAGVEHHTNRRTGGKPRQTRGQARVVMHRRVDADEDSVVTGALQMCMRARRFAGYPLRMAALRGDASVQAGCRLPGDKRSTGADALHEAGVEFRGLKLADAEYDFDTGLAQSRHTITRNARIRVLARDDDAADTGGDQRFGTGWRTAMVIAGFETDEDHRAARGFGTMTTKQIFERRGFGMRPTARLRPAARQNHRVSRTIAHDDAADCRIGPDIAETALRKAQGRGHETVVTGGVLAVRRHPRATAGDPAVNRPRQRAARYR